MLSENVHMFLLARRVLLNIGLRYHHRLQTYISLLLLGVVVTIAGLLISAMGGSLELNSMVMHTGLDVVGVLGIVVACIMQGSQANALAEEHKALLQARQVQVNDALVSAATCDSVNGPDVHAELLVTKTALIDTRESLEFDDKLHAVKIVGVRASPALFRSIILGASTLLSVVLRILLSSSSF